MPVAYLTTLDGLARSVGAPRIVRGKAITNVAGDPNLRPSDEKALRKELISQGAQGAHDASKRTDGI